MENNQNEINNVQEQPVKRKRGRPKKSDQPAKIILDNNGMVQSQEPGTEDALLCETNMPYEGTYNETNYLLRESIGQINRLSSDVQSEIDNLRNSKTIKSKYKYIADLCSTASTLVGTKLTAIREINNTITTCHKLEIQRFKDMKNDQDKQDDDKYIADLYNAYISTPINTGSQPQFLNNNYNNAFNNPYVMNNGINIGNGYNNGYDDYMNSLSPEENRMILDGNPNIETVLVYNPETQEKYFDVIDSSTGQRVSNYPVPDQYVLDDIMIDFQSGIATNTNIGMNWKVVIAQDSINNF